MPESLGEVPETDMSRPHPARVYDYWLGGCFRAEFLPVSRGWR
jgi:hypothetical protein